MRKALLPLCLLVLSLPLTAKDSSELMKDFTRVLPNDSLSLSLLHLNETTLPIVFQPPTLYAIRLRAKDATLFYVQGTAEKAIKLDTTDFTIDQGGETITSTPMNIKHFEKGVAAVNKNDKVDGILVFSKIIDVTQPFVVRHGKDSVKIEYTKDQLKEMTPAPPK